MILAKVYFIKEYTKSISMTFFFVTALVFILDLAEVIRSGSQGIVLMTTCKTFKNMIQLMPLVILIGTIKTFSILSNKNELVIFSTLGLSNSFFLIIINIILTLFFIFTVAILIPVSAKLNIINAQGSDKVLIDEGGILFKGFDKTFVRAERVDLVDFHKITIWKLDNNFRLQEVIKANQGKIDNRQLILDHLIVYNRLSETKHDQLIIETDVTHKDIMSDILKPDQMSLFDIKNFVRILKQLGFSSEAYERYFWDKITLILNFFTMALLGFISSFSLVARLANKKKIFYGIGIGLIIFFTQDIIITVLPFEISIAIILTKIGIISTVSCYSWHSLLRGL